MNQRTKHTETSPNSYDAAAYGYDYRHDGFGGSAQASQSAAWSRTLTEHRSSLWITDGAGNACTERSRSVNQHLQYLPFGEQFIDQRNSNDIRFKFTGKERDSETGFDYFGARYYSSDISVWLSVDPLSDMYSSTSPFMYVRGNPIMLIDPDGMRIGDYYDKNKNYIGNDGIDDGKVYQVKDGYTVAYDNSNVNYGGQLTESETDILKAVSDFKGTVSETQLSFTGSANVNNSAQADGTLNIIQVLANGDEYTRGSFDAVGGPWGNGSPENGEYLTSNLADRGPESSWSNAGMTVNGIGFSLNLDPLFETNRTLLRIHPDGGNYYGTQGCIGLTGESPQLIIFRNLIENVLGVQTSIPTTISIIGNPNNNGTNNRASNGE